MEGVVPKINYLKERRRQCVWDHSTKFVRAEVKVAQSIQLAKFRWDLTAQLVIREVDSSEESEVGNARWYLAIEVE